MLCHTWQKFDTIMVLMTAHPWELTSGCLPFLSVNVKWGKEKFDAVELNTEEPPMVFKAQLFALTGVQPDRQKVMVKGGTLKVWILTTVKILVLKCMWKQKYSPPGFCFLKD